MFSFSPDSIEEYIQTTSSHVESANQELAKASHHQVNLKQPVSIKLFELDHF